MIIFFYDTLSIGYRWSYTEAFYPILSFMIINKSLGEAAARVKGGACIKRILLAICMVTISIIMLAIGWIFSSFFVYE